MTLRLVAGHGFSAAAPPFQNGNVNDVAPGRDSLKRLEGELRWGRPAAEA